MVLTTLIKTKLSISKYAFRDLFSGPLTAPSAIKISDKAYFKTTITVFFKTSFVIARTITFLFKVVTILLACLTNDNGNGSLGDIILTKVVVNSLFSTLISFVGSITSMGSILPMVAF